MIVAGVSYTLGYVFFYRAFEIGNVSIVSALINLQTLFILIISYFIYHQPITTMQLPVIAIIILGAVLVALDFTNLKNSISLADGVKETLIASMFFGILFWPINEYVVERANWITVTFIVKFIALVCAFIIAVTRKTDLSIKKFSTKTKLVVVIVGLLEALAVISVSFGVSYGDSVVVAPIAAALTIVTILLAIIFLKERVTRLQSIGILLVITGIIAMSVV